MSPVFRYLCQPAILPSLVIPSLVSLFFLLRGMLLKEVRRPFVWLFFACLPVSYLLSFWDRYKGFHIVPVFGIAVVIWRLYGKKLSLPLLYALSFFSHLIVDVVGAYAYTVHLHENPAGFFIGIGGAGIGDALLGAPLVMVGAAWLVDFTQAPEPASPTA